MKEEIKEDVNINVSEDNSNKIKEMIFTLNTGMDASIEHITDNINGEIQSLIIDCDKQVNVKISLENFGNIKLLNAIGFFGQKYIPLRIEAMSPDIQKLNFGVTKYYLNDRLRVVVDGNINSLVRFIIRYI